MSADLTRRPELGTTEGGAVVGAGAGDASQEYSGDASARAVDDASPNPGSDPSPRGPSDTCSWCRELLGATSARHTRFCSRKCRQAAFRLRRRRTTEAQEAQTGLVFGYADPPYPGRARKYYGKEDSYGGEVDHRELVARLMSSGYAGWALSTAADALREVLPLCPPEARVCAWVKPIGAAPRTLGLHNTWEPLIVVPGRRLRPGRRDWLSAQPARHGGALPGRKPIAFCAWLFDCMGMLPGDELVDLFPGTGVVGRAWSEASGYASSRARDDASPAAAVSPRSSATGSR